MKKVLSAILVAVMMFSFVSIGASAAGDTMATATEVTFGTKYTGKLTESDEKDFYKITLSESGPVTINIVGYCNAIWSYLYDVSGNEIWYYKQQVSSSTGMSTSTTVIHLTSGTYYFVATRRTGEGDYNFKVDFTSANESFKETNGGINETMPTASEIEINKLYNGTLSENEERDYYKFTLSSSKKITLEAWTYIKSICYKLYNENGNEIWYYNDYVPSGSDFSKETVTLDLNPGTYYFCVHRNINNSVDGNFSFSFSDGGTVTPYEPPVTPDEPSTPSEPAPENPDDSDDTSDSTFDIASIFVAIWQFFVSIFNFILGLFV